MTQPSEKVCHQVLLFKIRETLPRANDRTFESYLNERLFQVKRQDENTNLRTTEAGIPQGSVLGPLYILCTQVTYRHQKTHQLLT